MLAIGGMDSMFFFSSKFLLSRVAVYNIGICDDIKGK